MGEAKQKRDALKTLVLSFIERWDFAPSEAEAQAVVEIKKLPQTTVRRYPKDVLSYMRMVPNQCHANARFMQDEDPDQKCKQVSGYWLQQGNFVLHSVVEREGELFCVTPMTVESTDEFPFIPDPDIEWRQESDYRVAYRKGVRVEPGFRSDPNESRRVGEIVRLRIERGMHPMKAGEPPF